MMRVGRGEAVWSRTLSCGIAVLLAALAGGCSNDHQAGSGSSGSGPSKAGGPGTGKQIFPVGKEWVLDLGGIVKMEFVLVPAGSFQMGSDLGMRSEIPVHKVTLAKAFYMGKYEVTQEQWKSVMGSFRNRSFPTRGPKYPVRDVEWDSAQEFVGKLSQKTGRKLSLPSEAEWEYACRAGSTREYSFGDDWDRLGEYAWYDKNSSGDTHPVGQKKPNAWGLFDMNGNVWEWCEDVLHESYVGAPDDGTAWLQGGHQTHRVYRGGSWLNFVPSNFRSANRNWSLSTAMHINIGCRVVLRDF